jgi:hypothetical protein
VPNVNVGGKPNLFLAGVANSVAVDPHNNYVFVPLAASKRLPVLPERVHCGIRNKVVAVTRHAGSSAADSERDVMRCAREQHS